jgi:hypothetical protein
VAGGEHGGQERNAWQPVAIQIASPLSSDPFCMSYIHGQLKMNTCHYSAAPASNLHMHDYMHARLGSA